MYNNIDKVEKVGKQLVLLKTTLNFTAILQPLYWILTYIVLKKSINNYAKLYG